MFFHILSQENPPYKVRWKHFVALSLLKTLNWAKLECMAHTVCIVSPFQAFADNCLCFCFKLLWTMSNLKAINYYNQPQTPVCSTKPLRCWCSISIVSICLGHAATLIVSLWPPYWWCLLQGPVAFSSMPKYNLSLSPVIMVSLKLKKPLRPVAHKQQITANQKLNPERRQALKMKRGKQRPSRAKSFAVSLMLMNLIQSILCKTSLWW